VFGSESRKVLKIPKIIDDYNHNMNGVDVADQLRLYYNTQQTAQRNWMPLFYWLLDTAIINAYRIARTLGSEQEQKEFRRELVWDLVNLADDTIGIQLRAGSKRGANEEIKKEAKRPKVTKNFELPNQRLVSGNHFAEWRERREACQWCTWLTSKKNWIWTVKHHIKVSFGVYYAMYLSVVIAIGIVFAIFIRRIEFIVNILK